MISRILFIAAICVMILSAATFSLGMFLFGWLVLIPLACVEEIVRVMKAGGGPRRAAR